MLYIIYTPTEMYISNDDIKIFLWEKILISKTLKICSFNTLGINSLGAEPSLFTHPSISPIH